MVIIRDDERIARLSRISKALSLLGILSLVGGMVLAFAGQQQWFTYQLLALAVGWAFSQVGIYLANRYVRSPRPDEVLDEALGRVVRNGRLYHYVLPVPHVLLSNSGVIILLPKYQGGEISVEGDKWRQKGLGMRRFFGQETIGNPTKEAEQSIRALASFIDKNAPEVDEVPIGALIVFTHVDQKSLNIEDTRIPAMHHSKVKSYLRRKRRTQSMPQETYDALRRAFDAKAAHIVEEESNEVEIA